jgi:hypothetical protein
MSIFLKTLLLTYAALLVPYLLSVQLFWTCEGHAVDPWLSIPLITAVCMSLYLILFGITAWRLAL